MMITIKRTRNEKNTGKRKPAQGRLHGVLAYIQTAGNPQKGDTIALLKIDPFIRLPCHYCKTSNFFQMCILNTKNMLETLFQNNKHGVLS